MVQLIVGKKGKGKTKHLLDKVNQEVKEVSGSIVYLDKSTKHMYELNNKVRLIDVSDYLIDNSDAFLGFLCGIVSQDHDLEQMYLDSFLKIAHIEDDDITPIIARKQKIIPMTEAMESGAVENAANPSMAYRNNFQKPHFVSPATLFLFSKEGGRVNEAVDF